MFSIIEVAGFPTHCVARPAIDLPVVVTLPTEGFSDIFQPGVTVRRLCQTEQHGDADSIAQALSKMPRRLIVITNGNKVDAWMSYWDGIPTMVASRTAARIRHALRGAK